MQCKWLFLVVVIGVLGCNECQDCGPITNEPFFLVNFNKKDATGAVLVSIDSVNGVSNQNFTEIFQDTASGFRFPLSPVTDSVYYQLRYTAFANDTTFNANFIALKYQLQTVEDGGFIEKEAINVKVVTHDFDSLAPAAIDNELSSNEVTIQVYF